VNTIYDLVTIVLFAGLAILFLQRSVGDGPPRDRIYHYAPPAIGCAVANWLGNNHYDIGAMAVIAGVVVYVLYILKPFDQTL